MLSYVLLRHVVLGCRFLQQADVYRDWALFGFMICPTSLKGIGSMQLLDVLLRETLLLPIYKDIMKPVHVLFEAAGCGLEPSWLQAAWKDAAARAKDEHALRRMHMTRQLQDIADLVMVSFGSVHGLLQTSLQCPESFFSPPVELMSAPCPSLTQGGSI